MNKRIEVREKILARNDRLAAEINRRLTARGDFAVNVMGTPGAGKTSVLLGLIPRLGRPAFVIEGDIQSDLDARRLAAAGIAAVQVNTGGACHLDAPLIEGALPPEPCGILFIENIGNLVCPAEFMIGEHLKLLVASVAEGGDKPLKYPLAFEKAGAVILNKLDLLPHTDFDLEYFTAGVRRLNAGAPVFGVSCRTGAGLDEAARWLREKSARTSS